MKALYIIHPGKYLFMEAQTTETGALPRTHRVELKTRLDVKDKNGNYIEGPPILITLRASEVNRRNGDISVRIAYWPEMWLDRWGFEEVDRFLKNEWDRKTAGKKASYR